VSHRQQERLVDVRRGAERRLVDERSEATARPRDAERRVLDGDLGRGGMQPPGLCAHELKQEGVPAGSVDHDLQCGVADGSTSRLDGLTKGALDVGPPN